MAAKTRAVQRIRGMQVRWIATLTGWLWWVAYCRSWCFMSKSFDILGRMECE